MCAFSRMFFSLVAFALNVWPENNRSDLSAALFAPVLDGYVAQLCCSLCDRCAVLLRALLAYG